MIPYDFVRSEMEFQERSGINLMHGYMLGRGRVIAGCPCDIAYFSSHLHESPEISSGAKDIQIGEGAEGGILINTADQGGAFKDND